MRIRLRSALRNMISEASSTKGNAPGESSGGAAFGGHRGSSSGSGLAAPVPVDEAERLVSLQVRRRPVHNPRHVHGAFRRRSTPVTCCKGCRLGHATLAYEVLRCHPVERMRPVSACEPGAFR